MKKFSVLLAVILMVVMTAGSAMACSAIYVGSAYTQDGCTYFGRAEDLANSYNKMMFSIPSGVHTAGEEYAGCYGFTYTFTHDSYGYTAFQDDNLDGVNGECPDCGSTHVHTPYQAAGTNEMGVSVTATESLYGSEAAEEADPFPETGIEEAEITTVLLSEAATAREGVELLGKIFTESGSNNGAGVFIADSKEVWYLENLTGHTYVAVKLGAECVFAETNMSIIGKVDLDDTDNVIASEGLIELAKNAGLFVGDEEANVIDYAATFNADEQANDRMKNALKYFNPAYDFSETEPEFALYGLTNVDAEGNIVPLHTGIELDRTMTTDDVLGYYRIPGIGSTRNLETHVFQLTGGDTATDVVEWVAMNDAACNAFIPYYPMLTTDTADCLKKSTAPSVFTEEEPAEGLYYPTSKRTRVDGEVVTVEGFCTLPEDWAESLYWSVDAMTNLMEYGDMTEEKVSEIKAAMTAQQEAVYAAFETTKANVAAAATPEEAAQIATADSIAQVEALLDVVQAQVNAE